MISIRYFSPAPPLRPFLSSYYWFESNLPAFSDLMRAELPQIRLLVRGTACNTYADGHSRLASGATLQGPTSGPVSFASNGALHLFGVGLMPLGWARLLGLPADALADDLTDLAALIGAPAREALEGMAMARTDAARVAVADRLFLTLLAKAHAAPAWFTRVMDDWLVGSPDPDVDTLVAASGMSARSVERLALRLYGASPKLMARKYRALGAAVRLGTGDAHDWADAAGTAFYDQAHFIKEFKQFTGMTPARFLAEAAPVTRLTIARRQMMPDLPRLALFS